ncbi:MAG: AAA family ATPase [Pseudonocardia sp.]
MLESSRSASGAAPHPAETFLGLHGVLLGHGLRPRQRLLLLGPPGTGKSVSAHAIAAELSLACPSR